MGNQHSVHGAPGLGVGNQVSIQHIPELSRSREAPNETLLDLDPIPITRVAGGSEIATTNLLDIFDPTATSATTFLAVTKQEDGLLSAIQDRTPKTPKVGTTFGSTYTLGGTCVPDGPPPPSTPRKAVTFGSVTSTPLPASPIPPPPLAPTVGISEEPSRLVHHLPSLDVGANNAEASVVTGD